MLRVWVIESLMEFFRCIGGKWWNILNNCFLFECGKKPCLLSVLEAATFQIICLQYHMPEVFQMITEIRTTKQKNARDFQDQPFSTCPINVFPTALHPALAGLCLHLLGIHCSSHFYFRAAFHLILALSQLCTFSALSSTEVINHYRSYSSHSCTQTLKSSGMWLPSLQKLHTQSQEVTGMQAFAKQF